MLPLRVRWPSTGGHAGKSSWRVRTCCEIVHVCRHAHGVPVAASVPGPVASVPGQRGSMFPNALARCGGASVLVWTLHRPEREKGAPRSAFMNSRYSAYRRSTGR